LLLEAAEGRLSASTAILTHIAVLGFSLLAIANIAPRDLTPYLLAISLAAIAGPAGLIAGVAVYLLAHAGEPSALSSRWISWAANDFEFDAGAKLAERIESGRALRLSHPQCGTVPQIMGVGSFAEKQWLLGIVAQKYHDDFKPTLDAALRDSDPGLRVQAAAIRARLNDRAKAELGALLEIAAGGSTDPDTAAASVSRMIACLHSDLLDASEAKRLRAAAASYCEARLRENRHSAALESSLSRLRWDGGDYIGALQAQARPRTT
jgi:hypothetical protein